MRQVQEATLLSLVNHSAKTAFGRAHSFTRVRDYASFTRCVPVGDYDAFSPLIDRMRAGEHNLLVPEPVIGPVSVPDVKSERERLIGLGLTPNDVREFKNDDGSLIARYFFIQDPDGYKIEVLERHGHYE